MRNKNRIDNKIILPLSDESPITYDLRLAIPLMASLGHDSIKEDVWNWIITNYTQLVCKKVISSNIPYNYFHIYDPFNPFIVRKFECHYRSFWKNPKRTLEYVIESITNGNYVHMKMDRYFMPNFGGYKEFHMMHTECIYGFDLDAEELYLIGFTEFANSSLKRVRLSFDNFLLAIESYFNKNNVCTITLDKVNLLNGYSFDKIKMFHNLNSYLNSSISLDYICESNLKKQTILSWDFPINAFFGVNSISHMSKTILFVSEHNKNHRMRTLLQAMLEFYYIMLCRFKYLYEKEIIDKDMFDNFEEVYKKCNVIKIKFLKYELTNNKEDLNTLMFYIDKVNENTIVLLKKLLGNNAFKKRRAGLKLYDIEDSFERKLKAVIKIIWCLFISVLRDLCFFIKDVLFRQNFFRAKK